MRLFLSDNNVYLLLLLLGVASITAQTDNIESYTVGGLSAQSPHWRTWSASGATDDSVVSEDIAQSGTKSVKIGNSGVTDQLLKFLDLPSTGIYYAQWAMFIPAGNGGYFNMQGQNTPDGTDWNQYLLGGNVYFNQNAAAPGVGSVDGTPGQTFAYPENQWFTLLLTYDLDNEVWSMHVDGVEQFTGQEFTFNNPFVELAAIDFFSVDTNNLYYIDDVILSSTNPSASVEDLEALGFTAYPNPVQDKLTLNAQENISKVSIFNVMGQQIKSMNPNTLETVIDMSGLDSGAYFVKVAIGNTVGTIKIIK